MRFLTVKLDNDAIESIEKNKKVSHEDNSAEDAETSNKSEVYTNDSE